MDALFLEKLLHLLDQGSFTTTYKYAVLLALIDLSVQGAVGGHVPSALTVDQIAAQLIALYWRHAAPDNAGLIQSTNVHRKGASQAEILSQIAKLRAATAPHDRFPERAQQANPAAYARALAEVGWIAMEKPLPRLQVIGARHDPFLFNIDWTVRKDHGLPPIDPNAALLSRDKLDRGEITPIVRFVHGAADQLVVLAPMLRPILHRAWAGKVARINGFKDENQIEQRLFGQPARETLKLIREPLWDLQSGRCFFCGGAVALNRTQVDHLLPWSRCPDDSLENLVVADEACNRDKRDFLVQIELVERWVERPPSALDAIARDHDWPFHRERTRNAGAVLYGHLSPGTPVWRAVKTLEPLTIDDRERILRALVT